MRNMSPYILNKCMKEGLGLVFSVKRNIPNAFKEVEILR